MIVCTNTVLSEATAHQTQRLRCQWRLSYHSTRQQRNHTHLNQPRIPRHSIILLNSFQLPSVYGGYL